MAGLLKTQIQLGDSATATQNFVIDSSAADGSMKLARGNYGATTQDILTVDASGGVTATQPMSVPAATAAGHAVALSQIPGFHKIGTFTRDISVASGTQAITGLGFQPSSVIFFANIPDTATMSVGLDDGTNHYKVTNEHGATATLWYSGSADSITLILTGANYYTGLISALGADGFTVTWTKTGSPTGTANIYYMAFR